MSLAATFYAANREPVDFTKGMHDLVLSEIATKPAAAPPAKAVPHPTIPEV